MPPDLPPAHPQRRALNDEAHARPSEPLVAPLDLSYLVLLGDAAEREAVLAAVGDLAAAAGAARPAEGADHFAADLGRCRLRWERHTEFSRLLVVAPEGGGVGVFERPALGLLPAGWLAGLPGRLLVAAHLALRPGEGAPDPAELSRRHFGGAELVGSEVLDGRGAAFTDFRLHADGASRFLLLDSGLTPSQAGRTAQRLLEIETYRMMALLAFPAARALAPLLAARERELAEVAAALAPARAEDEAALLRRLTGLAAEVEAAGAAHLDRFAASAAYEALVARRIAELRERRIEGTAHFGEFVERRLAPAMATCAAVSARHEALSRRIARITQLLSTRVELTREGQVLAVLASMDRRATLQLRLQRTVEGLSVAAITYYVVGLVSVLAAGWAALGAGPSPVLATALAVPLVAALVALGLHRARRRLTEEG